MGLCCCTDGNRTAYTMDKLSPEVTTDSEESEVGSEVYVQNHVRSEGVCYRRCYKSMPAIQLNSPETHSTGKHPQLEDVRSMPIMKVCKTETHIRTVSDFVSHGSRNCEPSPRGHHRVHTTGGLQRASSVQPSRRQKMKERQSQRSVLRIQGEDGAKLYMDSVENNTCNELNRAFQMAEVMVHKGEDITVELRRQDDVMRSANNDIQAAELDINETSYKLKGMKSLRGKLGNMVRRKNKKRHSVGAFDFKDNKRASEQLRRSKTMPASKSFQSSSFGQTKQDHIKMGVKQLCSTLDIIKFQQMAIGEELAHQEGHLNQFQANMDRVDGKIQNQTKLMSGIR